MNAHADIQLTRLLQLASPALPVGAYSYSQGLEAAVEAKIVHDAASAARWIGDILEYSLARMEAPIFLRLIDGWRIKDFTAVKHWNMLFLASRESAEFRAETAQMGFSLRKLLMELEETDEETRAHFAGMEEISFPAAFACAVAEWRIPAQPALVAYLWSWLENQVTAALKAIPLGQTAGQRMLLALGARIVEIADGASTLGDDEIASFTPGLALLSCRHETQYSRLFRS